MSDWPSREFEVDPPERVPEEAAEPAREREADERVHDEESD